MRLYDSINDSSADITHFYRTEPRSQVGTAVPTDYATVKKSCKSNINFLKDLGYSITVVVTVIKMKQFQVLIRNIKGNVFQYSLPKVKDYLPVSDFAEAKQGRPRLFWTLYFNKMPLNVNNA